MDTTRPQGLPSVSLIICSRNRPQLLWETVQSVLAGAAIPAEIVIVDQSDQPHPALVDYTSDRPCAIRYRASAARGLSRARNEGLAAAQQEIVACLDDDMFVAPDWFSRLVHALVAAGPLTVVTGRVLPAGTEAPGGFVPAQVVGTRPAVYRGRIGKDVLAGGHMAAYRAVLLGVGGFDARLGAGAAFPAADDNDLGFRLLEAGYHIRYVPEAVVYHRAWRPARDYWRLRWSYGRGKGGFYMKHLSHAPGYMLRRMAKDIGQRALAFPGRAVADRRRAAGDIVYVVGMLGAAAQWLLGEGRRR